MADSGVLDVVDATYRLELDDRSWLRGVAEAARPVLDRGLGILAYAYDRRDPIKKHQPTIELIECPAGAEQIIDARFPRSDIEAVFEAPRPVSTLSETIGSSSFHGGAEFVQLLRSFGIADVLGIHASNPDRRGVILACPLPKVTRAFDVERWSRVSAHIAAAYRLRLEQRERVIGDDFVVDEHGRIEQAPEAVPSSTRAAISVAAVSLTRARGVLRKANPDEALAVWRALVLGKWSVLSEVETQGRRFVVARRNEPGASGAGLEALTRRERQVVGFACLGHANKLIAYELGLSLSTVATHLRKAAQKLGYGSRSALIRGCIASDLAAPPDSQPSS
ncbi:MAG: response regulator transcription factor [Deltaproteobacteria bacterium]|nr:response regulator transcription factor [Deltaproteobacteria bacterium]